MYCITAQVVESKREREMSCPHGIVTVRYCMFCMAEDLRFEEHYLEVLSQEIKQNERDVHTISSIQKNEGK